MMNEGVLKAVERLVETIYLPDQTTLVEDFSNLLEELSIFMQKMEAEGYSVDLTQELTKIQDAFIRKDYVLLADLLLYVLKPEFSKIDL